MKKVLYIGTVGFGNLGDDFCAQLIRSYIGGKVKVEWRQLIAEHALNDEDGFEDDLVLFGGGTLFNFRESAPVRVAHRFRNQNVVIFGSGVQDWGDAPMSGDGYNLLGKVGRDAQWIGCRGPISQASWLIAGRSKVYLTGDPIFLYEPTKFREESGGKRIALQFGLPSHSFATPGHLVQQMYFIAKNLLDLDYDPAWVSVWGRDLELLERVNRQFDLGLDIIAPGTFGEMVECFADFSASVTNRLHGGLASLMVGCPTVMIAHQTKTYDAALAIGWKPFYPCDHEALVERVVGVTISLTGVEMAQHLERIENFRHAQRKYLDDIIHDYL